MFWDASVFVALLVREEGTQLAQEWASSGAELWAWTLSPVEIVSALERRGREKALTAAALRTAKATLGALWPSVSVVRDVEQVKERAMRLLALHPLRSADACQLAGALIAVGERPRAHTFHCFDDRLLGAAAREGFTTFGLGSST